MSKAVQKGYNEWAGSYDAVENKTRDLDEKATQKILSSLALGNLLELGCGTGKNTAWLCKKATKVTAVDFSVAMMEKAKLKVDADNVQFVQADIKEHWPFEAASFNTITCNLILEHIADLPFIFAEAHRVLQSGGHFYISELHPFKQYSGSKARFQKEDQTVYLECYTHHVSDFFNAAVQNGFTCKQLNEWFDEDKENEVPRLITFLFEKK